jgi:hypothetical protein
MQVNVENKVLEGDSSLSAEKHSISVKARLYIFTTLFYCYELIVYICGSSQPISVNLSLYVLVSLIFNNVSGFRGDTRRK